MGQQPPAVGCAVTMPSSPDPHHGKTKELHEDRALDALRVAIATCRESEGPARRAPAVVEVS